MIYDYAKLITTSSELKAIFNIIMKYACAEINKDLLG
jgi:hypothetical protein